MVMTCRRGISRHIYGISMLPWPGYMIYDIGISRNIYGISMLSIEYLWNIYGILYLWNIFRISMSYLCDICTISKGNLHKVSHRCHTEKIIHHNFVWYRQMFMYIHTYMFIYYMFSYTMYGKTYTAVWPLAVPNCFARLSVGGNMNQNLQRCNS